MAFSMMSHAVRMLWANLGHAARVSVVPLLLMYLFIIVALTFYVMTDESIVAFVEEYARIGGLDPSNPPPEITAPELPGLTVMMVFMGILFFFIVMAFMAWVAIAWHRFILLEEYPEGWFPAFRWDEIVEYVWKLVLLSFVYGLVALIPILTFAIIGTGMGTGAGIAVLSVILLFPIFMWLSFRLSIVLPSAAVSRRMALGEAWRVTEPHSGTIFWFGVIYLGVTIGIQIVVAIFGFVPILGALASLFGSWFTTILGFSALTTVYGVAVEGREPT
ncbi:MAG: hypothetical protein AAGF78_03800 [Pseudomonadota bacterium]